MEPVRQYHDPELVEELLYAWDFYRDALCLLFSSE